MPNDSFEFLQTFRLGDASFWFGPRPVICHHPGRNSRSFARELDRFLFSSFVMYHLEMTYHGETK